jgi:hypothetical protein
LHIADSVLQNPVEQRPPFGARSPRIAAHEPNHRVLNDVESLVTVTDLNHRDPVRTTLDLTQKRLDCSTRIQRALPVEACLFVSDAQC